VISPLDRRVLARHRQTAGASVFRVNRSSGEIDADGVRYRDEHLLRQDRANGAGGQYRQPLPESVMKIGDYLIILAVALVVLILIVAALPRRHRFSPHWHSGWWLLDCSDSCRDAPHCAIGENGRRRASPGEKEAIVTACPAIEELAGVDGLCSDKTGTLTQTNSAGVTLQRGRYRFRSNHSVAALPPVRKTRTHRPCVIWRV